MKLGELKVAIRTMKGNPKLATRISEGEVIWVAVQKSSLIEALNDCFEHKGTETGLSLVNGRLGPAQVLTVVAAAKPMALEFDLAPIQIDLEDYIAASTDLLDLDI